MGVRKWIDICLGVLIDLSASYSSDKEHDADHRDNYGDGLQIPLRIQAPPTGEKWDRHDNNLEGPSPVTTYHRPNLDYGPSFWVDAKPKQPCAPLSSVTSPVATSTMASRPVVQPHTPAFIISCAD